MHAHADDGCSGEELEKHSIILSLSYHENIPFLLFKVDKFKANERIYIYHLGNHPNLINGFFITRNR